MKQLLLTLFVSLFVYSSAQAETFTMAFPTTPDKGGTAYWGNLTLKHLNNKLKKYGHVVVSKYIPGQRGKKAMGEWVNKYSKDPRAMMLANGGNGEAFLIEPIKGFDYRNYAPIGLMNTTIWISSQTSYDPKTMIAKFPSSGGTGFASDMIALGMLTCGPDRSYRVDTYIKCFSERLKIVGGFKSRGERRMAFINSLLTASRATPQSTMMANKKIFDAGTHGVLFSHGIRTLDGGKRLDPNAPKGHQSFEQVYENTWGVKPSGDVYDAYDLFQAFRDGFQKTIWISKDSKHREVIQLAFNDMISDPEVKKDLDNKLGTFDWYTGLAVDTFSSSLFEKITKKKIENLVELAQKTFKYKSAKVKPELF